MMQEQKAMLAFRAMEVMQRVNPVNDPARS